MKQLKTCRFIQKHFLSCPDFVKLPNFNFNLFFRATNFYASNEVYVNFS